MGFHNLAELKQRYDLPSLILLLLLLHGSGEELEREFGDEGKRDEEVLTLVVAIPTHQGHIQEVSGSHTLLQLNHIFRIFYLKYLRRIGKDMETIARIMES